MFKDDYKVLPDQEKVGYQERQKDHQKELREKQNQRSGQALASDVTKTQNAVTDIVSIISF